MIWTLTTLVLFLFAILIFFVAIWPLGSRERHLPPGPPTRWLIGNAHLFSRERPHLAFADWAWQYGDVISFKIFHRTIILLNTPTAVKDLIDKRSTSCSNRPHSMIGDRIIPNNTNFGMAEVADQQWKVLRKAATGLLSHDNLKKFTEIQVAESRQLMWDLCHTPDRYFEHIHRFVVSFAAILVYGRRSPRVDSSDISEFLNVHPKFMDALNIGMFIPVDLFPILDKIPLGWQKKVTHVRKLHEALYSRLMQTVETRLEAGAGNGCFLEDVITHKEEYGIHTKELIMNLGGVLLQGSDTSSSALHNLIFCLVCYPEAQEKAFREVDEVIGRDRPPTLDDLPKLPYVRAFIEEANRLRPVDPLGLPHSMNRDEVIDGNLYPKDATVFINVWAIMHDERYFENPEEFRPERFLQHPFGVRPDVEDDPARRPYLMFGGGRRVCLGINFAQTSFAINALNFIWGFHFLPAKDTSGNEVYPDMSNYTTGLTSNPKPTKIRIIPRSERHIEIIQRCFSDTAPLFAPFEEELDAEDKEFNAKHRNYL